MAVKYFERTLANQSVMFFCIVSTELSRARRQVTQVRDGGPTVVRCLWPTPNIIRVWRPPPRAHFSGRSCTHCSQEVGAHGLTDQLITNFRSSTQKSGRSGPSRGGGRQGVIGSGPRASTCVTRGNHADPVTSSGWCRIPLPPRFPEPPPPR